MTAHGRQGGLGGETLLSAGLSAIGTTVVAFSLLTWMQEEIDWKSGLCGTPNAVGYCASFLPGHYTAIYGAIALGCAFILVGFLFTYRYVRARDAAVAARDN